MGPVVQSVPLPSQSPLILGLGELKTGLQRRLSIMKGGGQKWNKEKNNTPHKKSWGHGESPSWGKEGKDPIKLVWVSLTCLSLSILVLGANPAAHSAE